MKGSPKRVIIVGLIVIFVIGYLVTFVAYPDVGEKILYGKHPPGAKSESLDYSEIIVSENYECMESASLKAKGELPKFVKEFNECNN